MSLQMMRLGVVVILTLTILLGCATAFRIRAQRRRESPGERGGNDCVVDERASLEQARQDARRARRLASLAATLDLDELLEQVIVAAVEACGGDAAGIALKEGPASVRIETTGLRHGERAPSVMTSFGQTANCSLTGQSSGSRSESSPKDRLRTALYARLVTEAQEQLGTLAVYWRRELEPGPVIEDVLNDVAQTSARAIQNAYRYKEAYCRAVFDGLTGLYNRRYFDEALKREVLRARRYERSLTLLLLDLDGFKAVNDESGHLAGDAVLKTLAEGVRSVVRGVDIACRVGGDEFGVLLPEASVLEARHLEKRLHATFVKRPIAHQPCVGWTTGIAELQAEENATSLFNRADQAMLARKRVRAAGRPGREGKALR